jgi:filamentous hemagglutinin family protein
LAAAVAVALAAPCGAQVPTGGTVTAGTATIVGNGAQLNVNQTTARAVIDWAGGFSIGPNNSVVFTQPNAASVTLNRDLNGQLLPSSIQGTLQANGHVFILNHAGVLFGPSASVNVGGLVASSLSMTNDAFMAGKYVLTTPANPAGVPGPGLVSNQGKIVASPGGSVLLAAPQVSNEGIITTPGGTSALVSADSLSFDLTPDGLTKIIVNGPVAASQISNIGEISADGGAVTLLARPADAATLAVSQAGIVRARTLDTRAGVITLDGGSGYTELTGLADATGTAANHKGGTVAMLGGNVGLLEPTPPSQAAVGALRAPGTTAVALAVDPGVVAGTINASGAAGGGIVTVQASSGVAVAPTASITANALTAGNGGAVTVSGAGARVLGTVQARGAGATGNGGNVSVNGANGLDVSGARLDAGAATGAAGTVTVASSGTITLVNGNAAGTLPANPYVAPVAANVQDGDISRWLDTGSNVTISARGGEGGASVQIGALINGAPATPVAITRSNGATPVLLRLESDGNVLNVVPASIISKAGPLNVDVNMDPAGVGSFGNVRLSNVLILTQGGALRIYGQGDPVNGAAPNRIELTDVSVDTRVGGSDANSGGAVVLRGTTNGADGRVAAVRLAGTQLTTSTGNVTLDGRANGASGADGVWVSNGQVQSSIIQTTTGNVDVFGRGDTGGFANARGVALDPGTQIVVGTGGISIRGRVEGAGSDANNGALLATGVEVSGGTLIQGAASAAPILIAGESVGGRTGVSFAGVDPASETSAAQIIGTGVRNVVLIATSGVNGDKAIVLQGTINTGGTVNLRPGGVNADGTLRETAETVLLTGEASLGAAVPPPARGFALTDVELGQITAGGRVVGSDATTGTIAVTGTVLIFGNLTLQNAGGGIVVAGDLRGGTAPADVLALVSGGSITQAGAGRVIAANLLVSASGAPIDLSTNANQVGLLAGVNGTGAVALRNAGNLTIGSLSARTWPAGGPPAAAPPVAAAAAVRPRAVGAPGGVTATGLSGGTVSVVNTQGNLTLQNGVSGTGNVDLVTPGVLLNPAGAIIVAGGRWRVFANTWVGEQRGGLQGSGALPNLYNCAFGAACAAAAANGNGFVYQAQPAVTVTIGDQRRAYGDPNPTTALGTSGLQLGDTAAGALSGTLTSPATAASPIGTYALTGTFQSPAGYAVTVNPGTLTVIPAQLVFIATPTFRPPGQANPPLTGTVAGLRNGDTLDTVLGGAPTFITNAGTNATPGRYAINGLSGLSPNYEYVNAPQNATALIVAQLPTAFSPGSEAIRETPTTYLQDRNLGPVGICSATGPLIGSASGTGTAGDTLEREWGRLRSRPNVANCVDTGQKGGCSDF